MEEKAQIIIYDDLVVIDETETFFKDKEQLASIASTCLRSTPNAEMVEVYINGKLNMKFKITNRGKVKKESLHPGWGGARPNSGPKPKFGETMDCQISFRVSKSMYDFINSMVSAKRANWLRSAISEKMEREQEIKV